MIQDITSLLSQIRSEKDIFQKSRLVEFLLKEKDLRIIDLANKIGYKSSFICHLLRLKKIPDIIVDGYYSKTISSSHIYVISRLSNPQMMIKLYERILGENFTVKQTENAVRDLLYQVKSVGKYINKESVEKYSKNIKEIYPEIETKIIQTRIRGRIILEIKGDLEKSSREIKNVLQKLSS